MAEFETVTGPSLDKNASWSRITGHLCLGFMLVGLGTSAGLIALKGHQSVPAMTSAVYESRYQDVDQTCEALKTAIESQGMCYLATRNPNKFMAKHGVHFSRQARVVEFCQADYAYSMLRNNPEICTLMPYTLGVYEADNGMIYISSMNQRLMSKMFGETVAKVINEGVIQDEARMLNAHIRRDQE